MPTALIKVISIKEGYPSQDIRSEKYLETSFDWNYNVCSHFAMIKLKLFELGGVDDVDVGRVSEW